MEGDDRIETLRIFLVKMGVGASILMEIRLKWRELGEHENKERKISYVLYCLWAFQHKVTSVHHAHLRSMEHVMSPLGNGHIFC